MTITFAKFNKSLNHYFLFEKNPRIAVGVSGGPDSIALVFILNQWIKKNNGEMIALIVDHQIRKESFFESLQTKKYLDSNNINNKILVVSNKKILQGKMDQARDNRFEIIINYCKKNNIFHFFLGHHFDDNVETFLLRKIAGSNLEGLNCMQHLTIYNNIQIIRPLLSFSKKEIFNFNKKFNLEYINDPSNLNIKYSRTLVRNYLFNNKYLVNEIIKDLNLVKNNYLQYKKMVFQILNLTILEIKFKKIVLDLKKLLNLNHELQVKLFNLSFKFVNDNTFNIRSKKINNIIKKLKDSIKDSIEISLRTQNTLIRKKNDYLIISKK